MSMERWNPLRELEAMRAWMDRFFEENLEPRHPLSQGSGTWTPAVDLVETAQGYELRTALPGIRPEDIELEVDRDLVTIRGESRPAETEQSRRNYLYRERRSGSFYRQIRLPQPVQSDKVQAYLEHGELRLELPRSTQTTTRSIPVQSASHPYGRVGSGTSASQGSEGATPPSTQTTGEAESAPPVRVGQQVYGSDRSG